jgi:hypothetical protein
MNEPPDVSLSGTAGLGQNVANTILEMKNTQRADE